MKSINEAIELRDRINSMRDDLMQLRIKLRDSSDFDKCRLTLLKRRISKLELDIRSLEDELLNNCPHDLVIESVPKEEPYSITYKQCTICGKRIGWYFNNEEGISENN